MEQDEEEEEAKRQKKGREKFARFGDNDGKRTGQKSRIKCKIVASEAQHKIKKIAVPPIKGRSENVMQTSTGPHPLMVEEEI